MYRWLGMFRSRNHIQITILKLCTLFEKRKAIELTQYIVCGDVHTLETMCLRFSDSLGAQRKCIGSLHAIECADMRTSVIYVCES